MKKFYNLRARAPDRKRTKDNSKIIFLITKLSKLPILIWSTEDTDQPTALPVCTNNIWILVNLFKVVIITNLGQRQKSA